MTNDKRKETNEQIARRIVTFVCGHNSLTDAHLCSCGQGIVEALNAKDKALEELRRENAELKLDVERLAERDAEQKRIIEMSISGQVNETHLSVPEMQVSMLNDKIAKYKAVVEKYCHRVGHGEYNDPDCKCFGCLIYDSLARLEGDK